MARAEPYDVLSMPRSGSLSNAVTSQGQQQKDQPRARLQVELSLGVGVLGWAQALTLEGE